MYAPQDATTWSDGYPAAATPVPPESPQGKVEVTSFGVVEITPDGAGPIAVLHVRLAIANEADLTPWTITTTDQETAARGVEPLRNAFNADSGKVRAIFLASPT